ncbi:MAG: PAS domain S-box protein, partial [Candidatus Kryptonium sp.]
GKIVKCNRKAVEIGGGKDESDLIGKPVLDFVHPDYREIVKERIKKMIEKGEPAPPIEEKFIRLDGNVIDVDVRASRIMWEGRPAVQVVFMDVSEVKRLQRELADQYKKEQELKLRLESILKNISEGIMFQNDQGVIEFVNDEFCKILGYSSPEELIGKTFTQFLSEIKGLFEDEGEIDKIKGYVDNREFVKYSESNLKNGKVVERVGIPVFENEKYVGRISLLRDITERKHREKQVLELQRFEVLGQLASGIAHDFNNVLGIINGMLEIIKIKTTDKNILNYVDSALSAVQRGGEISKRLLQFSKRKVEEFNPISVRSLVLDCVRILEHTTPKNIEIKTSIAEDFIILGSCGDLQQVILNLALNARDAMPNGGKLTISVSSVDKDFVMKKFGSATSDTYVVIVVSDTGVGISDEIKEKIFEPFFTTKEPGKGTGLGLPIVKNVVAIHGGFVDFESLVGKGTSFYVYLPVQLKEEKAVKTNRGEEKMVGIGHGYKVLVIEDEESLRVIMRDYLEMLGFTVIEVSDGELGIQKFVENPDIKIVFVDYGLPKVMGDEVIKRINQISKDVKFVLVTGFVDIGDEVRGSLPAGTKFLRKPYTLAQIKNIVNEVLEGKGE